jgi:hypothetical protein
MNKGQVIGLVVTGLAVVGGIAVFNFVRKPKPNADGFFNASGKMSKTSIPCRICISESGNYFSRNGRCKAGDICSQ